MVGIRSCEEEVDGKIIGECDTDRISHQRLSLRGHFVRRSNFILLATTPA